MSACHLERSEGSGCLLDAAITVAQARTEIPRFARDDKSIQFAYSTGEDARAYIGQDARAYIDRRQLCTFL